MKRFNMSTVVSVFVLIITFIIGEYTIAQQPPLDDTLKMRISIILIKTKPEAQQILQKLDAGIDFIELASQHSIGPGKEQGGDLGYFAPGDMMEKLNDVVVHLKIGEYSEIVETSKGYFILMKTDEKFASETTLTAAEKSKDVKAEPFYTQSIAMQNLTRGVEHAAQGKFIEAKKEFETTLKVDSFNGPAKEVLKVIEDIKQRKIRRKTAVHLFKGISYYNKEEWDDSVAEFTKAIEINPRYAYAYHIRGSAYQDKGLYDQAISDFTKAIEIDPRDAKAYVNRGVVYGKKRQYDQSIFDLTKAIEIDPRDAKAYYNRGLVYGKKRQYDQAISDLTKAIEIDPRDSKAYVNLGCAYQDKGLYDQAISEFNKAIEIDPRDAEAYVNRGVVFAKKRQYDQAIFDLTKVIEIDPGFAMAYNIRAVAYFGRRKYEKAWDDVHKAQNLGYQVAPRFLKNLRKASGRQR